jgi:hypothetical protein
MLALTKIPGEAPPPEKQDQKNPSIIRLIYKVEGREKLLKHKAELLKENRGSVVVSKLLFC